MNQNNNRNHTNNIQLKQPSANQTMFVECYGAGSEVGRSSILVEISGKRILLDSGVNIGTNNRRKWLPEIPDDLQVDLILISHIHGDHLDSLPWLTEVKHCNAPIYMTRASKMLAPIILNDFIKVTENPPYNHNDIESCMCKINTIEFNQRMCVNGIQFTAIPAGHILGACAFYISCGGRSVLYTGDFSAAADHHLSGHQIPRLFPDILITESTYGDKNRESMFTREKNFVQMVHKCVSNGGNVLIPVFAVGRLQEICLMLNDYWERIDCKYSIYFASKMGADATTVYSQAITYMNPTFQSGFFDEGKRTLNFSKIIRYNDNIPLVSPYVMVATSGMLTEGNSYELFIEKKLYDNPRNLIIFPGYCGESTLGRAILERGPDNHVVFPKKSLDFIVKCKIERITFSAHADQYEIVSMCERLKPRNVVTVHGDRDTVKVLSDIIKNELNINSINAINRKVINFQDMEIEKIELDKDCINYKYGTPISFIGGLQSNNGLKIISLKKAAAAEGSSFKKIHIKRKVKTNASLESIKDLLLSLKLCEKDDKIDPSTKFKTRSFDIEFIEDGLLLSFDLSRKKVIERFCCLLNNHYNMF